VTDGGSGGTLFTVNNNGQVYVNGNINYSGGGNSITNNNITSPYGLYINGTTTNSGGGSTTTANKANKATLQSTNVPFYTWIAAQSGSPLPVTLLYFKVNEITKDNVQLEWSTASEENSEKFVVERSSTGKAFEPIAEILSAGNSKVILKYSYTDKSPLIGKNYYRLKSVDLDGKFEYSGGVVQADFESAKEFSIYPNPSTGASVNFTMNFEPEEGDVISIIDFSGAEIMHGSIGNLNGQVVFTEPLKTGVYLVKYTSSNFQRIERLVVR
jgi:hypothetical protein